MGDCNFLTSSVRNERSDIKSRILDQFFRDLDENLVAGRSKLQRAHRWVALNNRASLAWSGCSSKSRGSWELDRVAGGNTDHINHIWVDEWVDLTSHDIDAWEDGNWIAQVAALGHIAVLEGIRAAGKADGAKALRVRLGLRSRWRNNSSELGASLVSSLASLGSVLLGLHRLGKRASLSNQALEARLVFAL